jgi:hypothetical protein
METLEVTGRRSGRTVSLPIVVAVVDGQRYLVSMLGENVNWVQNIRALVEEQCSAVVAMRRSYSKRFPTTSVPQS